MDAQFVVAGTLGMMALGGMAWTFTAGNRLLAEAAFGAMDDIKLKQDAAAALVGRTASQLSAQKVGRERLNALPELLVEGGRDYQVAFAYRLLAQHGIEVPKGSVVDLIEAVTALLAARGEKREEAAA